MNPHSIQNILAISLIKGVGSIFMKKNRITLKRHKDQIDMLALIGGKINKESLEEALPLANKIITDCEKLDIKIITIAHDNYPEQLLTIKDPPPVLYFKGNESLLTKCIAIIGSATSSDLGNKIGAKVARHFSNNWSICNALQQGIDEKSILQNGKALKNVIGVLSGGLQLYNTVSLIAADLARKILGNKGLIISAYSPYMEEDPFNVSKTYRIVAGLARGMILIQSNLNDPCKYAIRSFAGLNRPLGIINFDQHPGFKNDVLFAANRLILQNPKAGIRQFGQLKPQDTIRFFKIIEIKSQEDYEKFENALVN